MSEEKKEFFELKKGPNFEITIKNLDSKEKKVYKTSSGLIILDEKNKNNDDKFNGINYIFGAKDEIAGLIGVLLSKLEKLLGKNRLNLIIKIVSNWDKISLDKFKKVGTLN